MSRIADAQLRAKRTAEAHGEEPAALTESWTSPTAEPESPETSFVTLLPDPEHGRRRRRLRRAVIVAALIVASAAGYYAVSRGWATPQIPEFRVQRGTILRVVAGKGTYEPYAELRITANMMGRIERILVEEGDRVERGQILAQMEDGELLAQLAQAQALLQESRARLDDIEAGPRMQEVASALAAVDEARAIEDEAQKNANRADRLFAEGMISAAQLEEAQRQQQVAAARHSTAREQSALMMAGVRPEVRAAARARVRNAEADLQQVRALMERSLVRSPVDGVVVRRFMQPGEVIVMQRPQPILTVADLRRVQVRAEIDEADAQYLVEDQAVSITSDAYPGEKAAGKLLRIGTTVGRKNVLSEDPAEPVDVKVVEAIVDVPEPPEWTLGLTVDVAIAVERRENVLVVPRPAVEAREGKSFVQVRSGEKVVSRQVTVGGSDDEYVEIQSGVTEGETVLVR